jgi:hypothetical protein
VGNYLADHSRGRGFHLAVMLGRSEKSGQPEVRGFLDERHFPLPIDIRPCPLELSQATSRSG